MDPDVGARAIGMMLSLGVMAYFLGPWVVAPCAVIVLISEGSQIPLERHFDENWRSLRGRLLLASIFIGSCAFMLPAAMAWRLGEFAHAQASLFTIVGSLLHTFLIRGASLERVLAVGIPQVLAAFSIPVHLHLEGARADHVFVSALSVVAVFGYFIHAYLISEKARRALVGARRAAEAANAAKSEFIATISHELRTPLNGVLGIAQTIRAAPLPAETEAHMETLEHSARMLDALIGDLLDITRVEAGRLKINPRDMDPRREFGSVAELFRALAVAKGLTLTVAVAKDVPRRVVSDPVRLRQCLGNLLSNAIKYSDRGRVRVTVGMDSPDMLAVEVTDEGIGVAPEVLPLIFDRYHRAHDKDQPAILGLGLGLTVTRDLARAMGGDVTARSRPGEGSAFRLTVRVGAAQEEALRDENPGPAGRRVLVVDDTATNRLVAAALLRTAGYAVAEAEDGAAALRLLRERRFDLVLLDIQMPVMDGPATLAAIRAAPEGWRRVPVIAATADGAFGRGDRAQALGFDGYVAKPLDRAALLAEARRLLAPRQDGAHADVA